MSLRPAGTFALALSLIMAGCASRHADHPPKVRYGQDTCSQCGMLISEARFAAAAVSKTGKTYPFDDIGCLLRYHAEHPEVLGRLWVFDYETEQVIDAAGAFFVHSKELATPMGSGIVALATHEAAARLEATIHGEVLPFEALSLRALKQFATHPSQ